MKTQRPSAKISAAAGALVLAAGAALVGGGFLGLEEPVGAQLLPIINPTISTAALQGLASQIPLSGNLSQLSSLFGQLTQGIGSFVGSNLVNPVASIPAVQPITSFFNANFFQPLGSG